MFAGPVSNLGRRLSQQVGELLFAQPHQFRQGGFQLRRVLHPTRQRTACRFLRLANGNRSLRHFCVLRRRRGRRQQGRIVRGMVGAAFATCQHDRHCQHGDRHQAEHRAFCDGKIPRQGQWSLHCCVAANTDSPTRQDQSSQRIFKFQHDIAPHTVSLFGKVNCPLRQHICSIAVTLWSQPHRVALSGHGFATGCGLRTEMDCASCNVIIQS